MGLLPWRLRWVDLVSGDTLSGESLLDERVPRNIRYVGVCLKHPRNRGRVLVFSGRLTSRDGVIDEKGCPFWHRRS